MKNSKAELEKEVNRLRKVFLNEREQHHEQLAKARRLELELAHMKTEATASQIGLVRYVHALHRFAAWLRKHPKATSQMIVGEMSKFGPQCPCGCGDEFISIWDVSVGYDPRKDLTRSIVSAVGPLALSRGDRA